MSNFQMQVPFWDVPIRCETDGLLVCLNDMVIAANHHRLGNGKPAFQLFPFTGAVATREYVAAASREWGVPVDKLLYKTGRGRTSRTMAHISVAILLAEQISPAFHAKMHKTFIEGKLMEFRVLGGTEFQSLNSAVDAYLPDRKNEDGTGKNNLGVYITLAKQLRKGILGADEESPDWNKASVAQTHKRYEVEAYLVKLLRGSFIRDYEHLKEVVAAEVAA